MILPDVNILVYAYREDTAQHDKCKSWLESVINADSAFGLSELVLSGFLRIVTHPRIFNPPSSFENALQFLNQICESENCVLVYPGARHWDIFTKLCKRAGAKGNLVPDAYLAALAIESGSQWITTDRDYSRFEGLSWRLP